ncbi:MAG: YgiQ family radical SAM protein, partial [Clostridiales bacterium]|nr:YgiQ family radical SAM protein [Candidatus Coliplasma caballi]
MSILPFLPLAPERTEGRPDFVIVTGDAYVDHPSFGTAIVSRVLEAEGYSVAIIAQPDYKSCEAFKHFGKPRLAFLVNSGNIDSMVAHYTVAKKRRNDDYYSPGGKAGKRPDRAVIVYCNRIREAYGDVPIVIGGIEASTRRFAHYDYWTDTVRRSVLVDSRADLLTYGMGENILRRVAFLLDKGVPVRKIRDVRGTVFLESRDFVPHFDAVFTGEYDELKTNKKAYARAYLLQHENQDAIYGKALTEGYDDKLLVQNPPMPPLTREELDAVYALPYMRTYHPSYEKEGGVPAILEVQFSITHNRGCFGNCNFCSIAFHQGRTVTSRSIESCVREAELIVKQPNFKGYIHDVGGPSANFRGNYCEKAQKYGVCPNKNCLTPGVCRNMKVDHSEYLELLKAIEAVPGVKKVFVRSGLRYDYMLADKDDAFFRKIVADHVSGQLKVAPEHCCDGVLAMMGKPDVATYDRFQEKFYRITKELGKEQYLVPYLMSSHPGSTLNDAVELALYLKRNRINPEQVQDFYPTPGTASTCMFFTGIDPFTNKEVFVPRDYEEKKLQRALLQWYKPENAPLVRKALVLAGRKELIGFSADCLVKPRDLAGKQGKPGGKPNGKPSGKPDKKFGEKPKKANSRYG